MTWSDQMYVAEDFIGREREMVQLTETLVAGRSACLVGPTGSGKTLLLLHLAHSAALVLDQPPPTLLLDARTFRLAADVYGPLCRALNHSGDDELAAGQALNMASTPLLLLLDNLDQAGAGWTALVRSAIRGWINDHQLLVVATSTTPLIQAAPDMQNVMVQIILPPMPEREARSLVQHLLDQHDAAYPLETIREIILIAGGYPGRIKRAIELWQRSGGGATFNWKSTFREEFPQQATLADDVAGWNPALESQADSVETMVTPTKSRLRSRDKKERTTPTYGAEDSSDFLLMLALLSLAILGGIITTAWWGIFVTLGIVGLWVGLARWMIHRDGAIARLFVQAVRRLPLVGRFVPKD